MADLMTLQGWLAEAQVAYHKLLTGQATVSVSYEGKSVSFSQADKTDLQAYITSLQNQVAAAQGIRVRRGPINLGF
ncbi:gpW protein [Faunimonas pinastri]|uniref:GpW protein n=1 Tax=Faunimonas pinastri TaxID=1855383 RepID=A0A1H9QDX0_9HYPH|nr:gpW family head-tail joining protein [Faunimonas pinastri]SER58654.1 gpW protein [Faunimonas pinastri]